MLLDSLMPEFDATWIEHRVIDGRPADVYEVVSYEARTQATEARCLFSGERHFG
jgi:hypothetical protein